MPHYVLQKCWENGHQQPIYTHNQMAASRIIMEINQILIATTPFHFHGINITVQVL
jgi:hypothetical protein